MLLQPTNVAGVLLIEPQRQTDQRGFFARTYCREEFEAAGLVTEYLQCSVSFNPTSGTLRGMHYQAEPHGETKLIRCTRGAICDVLVDLRESSPTFLQHAKVELSPGNLQLLYVPEGIAHGFLTLSENSEVSYQISSDYHAESARGVRWNDPIFGIDWPAEPQVISARDRDYPDYQPTTQ